MTREEAIKIMKWRLSLLRDYCVGSQEVEAVEMAIEALVKMEAIQKVIDMPFEREQDDRRRYSKVVDIVKKDLA